MKYNIIIKVGDYVAEVIKKMIFRRHLIPPSTISTSKKQRSSIFSYSLLHKKRKIRKKYHLLFVACMEKQEVDIGMLERNNLRPFCHSP